MVKMCQVGLMMILLMLITYGCQQAGNEEQTESKKDKHAFEMSSMSASSSIRAIVAIDDDEMWFAGSKGQYGYTEDGGQNWIIDSLSHPNVETMEFRSLVVIGQNVFLLNVASPALLYKSEDKGASWKIVYQEDHEKAFYDSMVFWDEKEGIAFGDPVDSCISIIITRDGGNSWEKLKCDQIPAFAEGEAGFAASNTCVSVHDQQVWIGTGGAKARIFYSKDRGVNWEVSSTPISEGGQMTGIFSTAFYDNNNGIIWGGDWENQDSLFQNKAITKDGGLTWSLVSDGEYPGYRSCVQYHPMANGNELIAAGIPGISYSYDKGKTWEEIDTNSYYTARFSPSGNVVWLAGSEKLGRMVLK